MMQTKKFKIPIAVPILMVAVMILGGVSGYFIIKYRHLQKNCQPEEQIANGTQNVVDRVAKLMVLPQDEQPTVATVTDPEKLKDQPFFASAKQGDVVLIYTNAKKAILYDPVANKIIDVAPLTIGSGQ